MHSRQHTILRRRPLGQSTDVVRLLLVVPLFLLLRFVSSHNHNHHHHSHHHATTAATTTIRRLNVFSHDTVTNSNDPVVILGDFEPPPTHFPTSSPSSSPTSSPDDHDHKHKHDKQDYHHDLVAGEHRCGTPAPTLKEERIEKVRTTAFRTHSSGQGDTNRRLLPTSCDEMCDDQCITIQVRLNLLCLETNVGPIVPHPTAVADAALRGAPFYRNNFSSPKDIAASFGQNMQVLNQAFNGTPFGFEWDGTWQIGVSTGATTKAFENRGQASQVMGSGDVRVLDVFLGFALLNLDDGGTILGLATPAAAQTDGTGDGVYLRYDVLPNGGFPDNDLG